MSLPAAARPAVAVIAAFVALSSTTAVAATADFAIALGIGETLGLDFRNGMLRVAWGDNPPAEVARTYLETQPRHREE